MRFSLQRYGFIRARVGFAHWSLHHVYGGTSEIHACNRLFTKRASVLFSSHRIFIESLNVKRNFVFRYHLVSGSEDNTAKIWDLRQRSCLYNIPAHTNLISKAKFQGNAYSLIFTFLIFFSTTAHQDHLNPKTLTVSAMNGNYIVTASFDGTAKVRHVGSHI